MPIFWAERLVKWKDENSEHWGGKGGKRGIGRGGDVHEDNNKKRATNKQKAEAAHNQAVNGMRRQRNRGGSDSE